MSISNDLGKSWGALGGMCFVRAVLTYKLGAEVRRIEREIEAETATNSERPMGLQEAADVLRCSIRQLHRLRKQGLIRDCRRFGKEGTVNRSDVLQLASANEGRE